MDVQQLRRETLDFIEGCHADGWRWRYSAEAAQPTLYSACYAAMARSLYSDLDGLSAGERAEWAASLNAHQDEDGLYRDPVIFGQGWYSDDPLWCGRPHLTCHVIIALAALGSVAPREFALVAHYRRPAVLEPWLEARDFGERVGWTGNEIMNVGTLLQYARDFHGDEAAGRAVAFLLDWLDEHHLDPETGVWGSLDVSDPVQRSHAVQAAYHWWPLYLYDGRPVPCAERALDTVLATQNPLGGFGWGVHNAGEPFHSSACEDIDSIDPLARLSRLTPYRRDEVRTALERAAAWVLSNRTADGGFAFMRGRRFEYGHPQLAAGAGAGAMFPTWFRTLSLAILGKALGRLQTEDCRLQIGGPAAGLAGYPWHFVRCPGYQFWSEHGQGGCPNPHTGSTGSVRSAGERGEAP